MTTLSEIVERLDRNRRAEAAAGRGEAPPELAALLAARNFLTRPLYHDRAETLRLIDHALDRFCAAQPRP